MNPESSNQWNDRIVGLERRPANSFLAHYANPRRHPVNQREALRGSLDSIGWYDAVLENRQTGNLLDGHARIEEALSKNEEMLIPVIIVDLSPEEELLALASHDFITTLAYYDRTHLEALLHDVNTDDAALQSLLSELAESQGVVDFGSDTESTIEDAPAKTPTLADKFIVPPFSVLDARQGYWQERKRQWLAIGLQSELGRGDVMPSGASSVYAGSSDWAGHRAGKRASPGGSLRPAMSLVDGHTVRGDGAGRRIQGKLPAAIGGQPLPLDRAKTANGRSPARKFAQDLMRGEHEVGERKIDTRAIQTQSRIASVKGEDFTGLSANQSGTSIFDPVLCELAYRWFTPPDAHILDPFAGGSVRGIVAALLNRQYTGVDLRQEQVAANQAQAAAICTVNQPRWITGDSRNIDSLITEAVDFIFSCPPYFDLEIYSDDDNDLSNTGDYTAFIADYRAIIAACCRRLKSNRFACFVVGDIRDKQGMYRNFVSDTINAFIDAGLALYNEAILVTAVGSLPIRAGKQFTSGRKLGKTHQNVLVFLKGDVKQAVADCGQVEVYLPDELHNTLNDTDSNYGEQLIVS